MTAGSMRDFTGMRKHAHEMEQKKKLPLMLDNNSQEIEPKISIQILESSIITGSDPYQFVNHLKQHFQLYDTMYGFYSNKKFKKAKLCRYIRKHEYLDKWIKQNIFELGRTKQ